jgi:hypothetical protein
MASLSLVLRGISEVREGLPDVVAVAHHNCVVLQFAGQVAALGAFAATR